MSNTLIQIKRSTSTSTPSTLSIGELAYSYQSNTLFIGNTFGSGVIAIGGAGTTDIANSFATSVGAAANAWANSVGISGNTYANAIGTSANNYAGAMANSANAYTSATYYAKTGGTVSGDMVVTGNLTISGVTTYANTQTLLIGDNILTLNADIPSSVAPSENAGLEINRGNKNSNAAIIWNETACSWMFTSNTQVNYTKQIASNTDVDSAVAAANAYSDTVVTANLATAKSYTDTVVLANVAIANAYSRVFANSVGASANAYADAVGASTLASAKSYSDTAITANLATSKSYTDTVVLANVAIANAYARVFANSAASSAAAAANAYSESLAANGSYISTGIVKVPYGGTGVTSFTTNGIVYGNNAGDLKVTSAGTEGQVLQASSTGIPQFGMLDGGSF